MEASSVPVQPLLLCATELFSKWGFGDGDCLEDWYWDATGAPFPEHINDHDVLRQLVRGVLVPAIEAAGHTVEVYDIETIHNPIRARSADGNPVPDEVIYGRGAPIWAKEISVTITLEQVALVVA